MLARNYVLDKLSGIDVPWLPLSELEKQIVFIHNSDQSTKLGTHWRNPQIKPDIVPLQWNLFIERPSASLSDRSIVDTPYSALYIRHLYFELRPRSVPESRSIDGRDEDRGTSEPRQASYRESSIQTFGPSKKPRWIDLSLTTVRNIVSEKVRASA